ncbi:hypothetical protein M0R45_002334 [Rubus argutus]|uniref:Uncharacterized protein n=1 Tax=Rubus argutus TaxID=59490 RepID=A0AAW1VH40_RUBAR
MAPQHCRRLKPSRETTVKPRARALPSNQPWLHLHGVTTAPIHVHHPSSNFQFTEPVSASPCFFTIIIIDVGDPIHGTHQLNCSIHHTAAFPDITRSPWSSLLPHSFAVPSEASP